VIPYIEIEACSEGERNVRGNHLHYCWEFDAPHPHDDDDDDESLCDSASK
jgi:hypothetical protein